MAHLFSLSHTQVESLIQAASLAPSGGNAQPWKVEVQNMNTFRVFVDTQRGGTFLDVQFVASFFALGCFLENFLTTAEHLGILVEYDIQSKFSLKEPVFIIRCIGKSPGLADSLFSEISQRVTNRNIYDGSQISAQEIDKLLGSISHRKYTSQPELHFLDVEEEKKKAADLFAKGDGIRYLHSRLYTEMMSEFRWSKSEAVRTKDGLDLDTLALPTYGAELLKLVKDYPAIRHKFPVSAFEEFARPLLIGTSHLGCVTFQDPFDHRSVVEAGMAMQRVWLTATRLRLSIQPWSVMSFFLVRLRYFGGKGFSLSQREKLQSCLSSFQDLFGFSSHQVPIFFFRVFLGKPPTHRSLRRDWREFTQFK